QVPRNRKYLILICGPHQFGVQNLNQIRPKPCRVTETSGGQALFTCCRWRRATRYALRRRFEPCNNESLASSRVSVWPIFITRNSAFDLRVFSSRSNTSGVPVKTGKVP